MEDMPLQNKSFQPKTMAELLPGLALNGIMSKDAILTLTGKKKPRNTAISRTAEKAVKPLTMAELRAELQGFTGRTPAKPQPATSTKKKGWNSSIKVDKKVNHTGDGKLRNKVVRKALNFQPPKPVVPVQTKTVSNTRVTMMGPVNPRVTVMATVSNKSRMTLMPADTQKFPKPEHRAKKSLYVQAKSNIRISGICEIPETPVETKPVRPRVTIANKENSSYQANMSRKSIAPKPNNYKGQVPPPMPHTPLSNDSWKSGSDASFIQKEKEIHETETITNAILDAQHTLENIAEVSPPVATPFREYRDNIECQNNSSVMDTSNAENDTIMCFDNPTVTERVNKEELKVNVREESVIVSLCDMLNKATVTNSESTSELDELLEIEKQTEHNIKMIEDGIQVLINIKESQKKALSRVRKQIREKNINRKQSDSDKDSTLVDNNLATDQNQTPEKSPVRGHPCSVISSSPKSPSYKIPKRTPCLRKRVFYKSMPSVVTDMSTPIRLDGGKALNMYMKMKEQLHFLNTPLVKSRPSAPVPDTPAVTSQNLQMQLNKLYNGS